MSQIPVLAAPTHTAAPSARGTPTPVRDSDAPTAEDIQGAVVPAADGTAQEKSREPRTEFAALVQGDQPARHQAERVPDAAQASKADTRLNTTARTVETAPSPGAAMAQPAPPNTPDARQLTTRRPEHPAVTPAPTAPHPAVANRLAIPPQQTHARLASGDTSEVAMADLPKSRSEGRILQNGTPVAMTTGKSGPTSSPQLATAAPNGAGHSADATQVPAQAPARPDPGQAEQVPKPPATATSAQALALASQNMAQAPRAVLPKPAPQAFETTDPIAPSRPARGEDVPLAPRPSLNSPPAPPPPVQTPASQAQAFGAPQPITYEESIQQARDTDIAVLGTDGPRAERTEGLTQLNQPRAAHPQAQHAAQIGAQMAAAARQVAPGTIELQLYPEELGRLRMQFDISEQTMIVSINADRPETADLMRRHIDQLAREMQALGYGDVQFQFADGGSNAESQSERDRNAPQNASNRVEDLANADLSPLPPPSRTAGESGLDLRI